MTPSGWLALAALCAITALPSSRAVRVERLASTGRLTGPVPRPPRLATGRPVAVTAAVAGVLAVGAVAATWARAGPALATTAAATLAVAGRWIADATGRRAEQRVRTEVVTAVRVLAGDLRAGVAPPAALAAAAAAASLLAQDFGAAAARAREGRAADEVLVASRVGGVRLIGAAWRVGTETGCPLADVLERVGTDLEADAAQRRATAVALAGPRSSAAVLAGLPVLGIALGAAMGARPLAFLADTSAGRVVGAVGVALDLLGVLWVRQILRRSEAAA